MHSDWSNSKPIVRKATAADLDQLAELFDAYRQFYNKPSDVAAARSFLQERLRLRDSEIFVADDDGTLAGFVQLYPLWSSTRMKRLWLFNDLFVHPHYRGRDVSKDLVDVAKELCRVSGSCGMMLETGKDNVIGNSLYTRTGWELDEEHNFYFWST
jgi:GNAT superfamily N-acetyltransferase